MKTSSRTLIGFGIGLAVLVIITIILVLTVGQKTAPELSDNTPQGVLQRYLLAVQEKNYPVAYAYLNPHDFKNPGGPTQTYEDWLQSARNTRNHTWKAYLGQVTVNADTASIVLNIDVFRADGPLANPINSNSITFLLDRSSGKWLIISPTDLYWIY
jgi:hypothetical protein